MTATMTLEGLTSLTGLMKAIQDKPTHVGGAYRL